MTRLVLPEDLLVTPVAELPEAQRDALAAQPGDAVLTRPRHRRRGLLVDADTAGLVQAFRVPTTVEEAVLLFALGRGLDPAAVLTDAYPALVHLQQARYLLPVGHAGVSGATALPAGTTVAGWDVIRALQVFDDGDVHEVRRGQVRAVLKRVHAWAPRRSREQLVRERQVLDLLAERGAGDDVPAVLEAVSGPGDDGVGPGDVAVTGAGSTGAGSTGAGSTGAGSTGSGSTGAGGPRAGAAPDPGLLVVSWLPGVDVGAAAGRLRHRHGPASAPALRLGAALARAYARLHALGVLHGDVHPANLLVDDLDAATAEGGPRVRLIDFGLAGTADGSGPGRPPARGGSGWAFEPELAEAALAGRGDPPLTGAGEFYSLAAVCFHLLTGVHHVDVPARREDVFDRLLRQRPRSLSAAAGLAEGSLAYADAAFARALDADPQRRVAGGPGPQPDPAGAVPEAFTRFAAALDAQADALDAAAAAAAAADTATDTDTDTAPSPDGTPSAPAGSSGRSAPAATTHPAPGSLLHRLLAGPEALPAPHASLTHGAAGVAMALLDLARTWQHDDPDGSARALAAADAWARHAAFHTRSAPPPAERPGCAPRPAGRSAVLHARRPAPDPVDGDPAFCSALVGLGPAVVGDGSLLHGVAGVHLAQALTALAVGDLPRARRSTDALLTSAAEATRDDAELVFGRAGLVLGAATLHAGLAVDTAHGPLAGVRARVRAWLGEATSRLLAGPPAPGWGVAHGAAGVLLAASLAHAELGPDGGDRERLARLHRQVLDVVAGPVASWCAVPGLEASWCNGTAGALLALDAAAAVLGERGQDVSRDPSQAPSQDPSADPRRGHVSPAVTLEQGLSAVVRDDLAAALATTRWRNASLCCGATGGAHALAVHAATTGRAAWWEAAARAADDAVGLARPQAPRSHSYVKGALGPLVLQAQIRAGRRERAGRQGPGASWPVPFHPEQARLVPSSPVQEQR